MTGIIAVASSYIYDAGANGGCLREAAETCHPAARDGRWYRLGSCQSRSSLPDLNGISVRPCQGARDTLFPSDDHCSDRERLALGSQQGSA